METHRIQGIKYNFDRLTDDELENIHGHLLEHHIQVTSDVGLVGDALFARRHDQLPLDNPPYEHLGGTALLGEVVVEQGQ